MIKAPCKRAGDIVNSRHIIYTNDKQSSLKRLQGYLAMAWVDGLTEEEKRNYIAAMKKIKLYKNSESYVQQLYDYYELQKWPATLEKINILKKKYGAFE